MRAFAVLILLGIAFAGGWAASAAGLLPAFPLVPAEAPQEEMATVITGDPFAGKKAFVEEGCVLCHAVRGTGGKLAPALDAEDAMGAHDPMQFAARIWAGAPLMIYLQDTATGYRIDLTGQDLADLAAFAASDEVQDGFGLGDVPEEMRGRFLDQLYEGRAQPDDSLDQEWDGPGEDAPLEDGIEEEPVF
jgi:mono/diheme cytochrome c family protein